MFKSKNFSYKVFGKYALFSTPQTKMGGERFSYMVPTYEALRGITSSIMWKPSIDLHINKCRVINPIRFRNKSKKRLKYSDGKNNTLSIYCYLIDVEYEVEFYYSFNKYAYINNDANPLKFDDMINKSINLGGRRDICLGIRECQGYVEPCTYGSSKSSYDGVNMDLGIMFHSFKYPLQKDGTFYRDNSIRPTNSFFWDVKMNDGEIIFISQDQCTIKKDLK